MSGIAEVLLNLGYEVSGSDLKRVAGRRERLAGARRARSSTATPPRNVDGADVVVISTAVRADNPEVVRGAPAAASP